MEAVGPLGAFPHPLPVPVYGLALNLSVQRFLQSWNWQGVLPEKVRKTAPLSRVTLGHILPTGARVTVETSFKLPAYSDGSFIVAETGLSDAAFGAILNLAGGRPDADYVVKEVARRTDVGTTPGSLTDWRSETTNIDGEAVAVQVLADESRWSGVVDLASSCVSIGGPAETLRPCLQGGLLSFVDLDGIYEPYPPGGRPPSRP